MVGVILKENLIWKRKALAQITSQNDNFNFVRSVRFARVQRKSFLFLGEAIFFTIKYPKQKRLLHLTFIDFSVQWIYLQRIAGNSS